MCFICSCLNQLDHFNILKEWMYFICSCLNQQDHYEYIERMDVFHMLIFKPTMTLVLAFCEGVNPVLYELFKVH